MTNSRNHTFPSDGRPLALSAQVEAGMIRAESVASKIVALRSFQYPEVLKQIEANPKLIELLWFLQFMSFQPGGLEQLAAEVFNRFPARLGTPTMHRLGIRAGRRYTMPEREAIYKELPYSVRKDDSLLKAMESLDDTPATEAGYDALPEDRVEQYLELCAEEKDRLPAYWRRLCQEPQMDFSGCEIWFFRDVIGATIELMDAHAAEHLQTIAQTLVFKRSVRECHFARSQKGLVFLKGIERIGKSTAVQAYALAWPGRARLVRVPSSNDMPSMFREVAQSLGIDCPPGTSAAKLKHTVEYIYQHSGLMLILDESHFAWPTRYTQDTKPVRLDWLRTQFIDAAVPVVLVITPQDFENCRKFEKKTNYRSKQFYGRKCLEVVLPEIDESDLLAVTQNKLPGLPAPLLKLVTARAMRSETWLQGVEAISRRARFCAEEAGRRNVNLEDIRQACEDVSPAASIAAMAAPAPCARTKAPNKLAAEALQRVRNTAATPLPSARFSPESAAVTPPRNRAEELETVTADT